MFGYVLCVSTIYLTAIGKLEEYRKADTIIYANNLGKISSWGVWNGPIRKSFCYRERIAPASY